MSQKGRGGRYPLDRPPDGMVVEPPITLDEENLNMDPSTQSRNNAMAPSDDEMLPPVTDQAGNPVPLDQLAGPEDAMVDAPVEIRRAAANMPSTGVHYNFAPFEQIAALAESGNMKDAEAIYKSLDPQSRYVYDNIRNMERVPAAEAARLADEYRKMQDSLNTPQAKLTEVRLGAIEQGTKEDAKKTYQRADNMIFLLDNLRGGPRDKVTTNNEKWRSRVGSIQGRWPSIISSEETLGWNADFSSLKGAINLTEAQGNKGQGPLSDGERVLMAQAASLGLEQARDEPGFEAAFERMYDMALEARQASEQKMSGKSGDATTPAQAAVAPAAAPAAPAAKPQAGFQVGKPYLDSKGQQRIFRGYAQDGKPLFSQ